MPETSAINMAIAIIFAVFFILIEIDLQNNAIFSDLFPIFANYFKAMEVKKPDIDASWYQVLRPQFEAPYFADLKSFLVSEKRQYAVYPPGPLIFNAFNLTPFER